jgi:hypothetical protein
LSKSPEELSRQFTTPLENSGSALIMPQQSSWPSAPSAFGQPATKKYLTSWNSLMITAFIEGYKATAKPEYLQVSTECSQLHFRQSQSR